jgi:hypothetical protein
MAATVEVLLLLIVVLLGLFIYKALVRSRWFARFVGGIIEPPADGAEVVDRLQADREAARRASNEAATKADEQARLKKELEEASREIKPRKPRAPRTPK